MFKVFFSLEAIEDLEHIEPSVALQIKKRIDTYLIQSPKELGKPLTGNYKGLYRYRYGDYRVLYEILSLEQKIIIFRIGHRSGIILDF